MHDIYALHCITYIFTGRQVVEEYGKQRDIGSRSKLIGLEVVLDCCTCIRLFVHPIEGGFWVSFHRTTQGISKKKSKSNLIESNSGFLIATVIVSHLGPTCQVHLV